MKRIIFEKGDEVVLVDDSHMGAKKGSRAIVTKGNYSDESHHGTIYIDVEWNESKKNKCGSISGQHNGGYNPKRFKLVREKK